jgi:hypothetical protein
MPPCQWPHICTKGLPIPNMCIEGKNTGITDMIKFTHESCMSPAVDVHGFHIEAGIDITLL